MNLEQSVFYTTYCCGYRTTGWQNQGGAAHTSTTNMLPGWLAFRRGTDQVTRPAKLTKLTESTHCMLALLCFEPLCIYDGTQLVHTLLQLPLLVDNHVVKVRQLPALMPARHTTAAHMGCYCIWPACAGFSHGPWLHSLYFVCSPP